MIIVSYSITCKDPATAKAVTKMMIQMDDILLVDGVSVVNLSWITESDDDNERDA